MRVIKHVAAFLSLQFSQVLAVVGLAQGLKVLDDARIPFDVDIAAILHQPHAKKNAEIFAKGLELVQELQRSSSCNRLAAFDLVDSCRTFERTPESDDHHHALEHTKNLYAARLAMCEFEPASPAPSACRPIMPKYLGGSKHDSKFSGFAAVTNDQVDACLHAFFSEVNWWTSYSTARKNAISICHTASHEREIDEVLEALRKSLGIHSDLTAALEEVTNDFISRQKSFGDALDELQERLGGAMHAAEAQVITSLEQIFRELTQEANDLTASLNQNKRTSDEVEQDLRQIEQFASEREKHAMQHQQQGLDIMNKGVENVQSSLEQFNAGPLADLQAAFVQIREGTIDVVALLDWFLQQEDALTQHFFDGHTQLHVKVNNTLDQIDAKASTTLDRLEATVSQVQQSLESSAEHVQSLGSVVNLIGLLINYGYFGFYLVLIIALKCFVSLMQGFFGNWGLQFTKWLYICLGCALFHFHVIIPSVTKLTCVIFYFDVRTLRDMFSDTAFAERTMRSAFLVGGLTFCGVLILGFTIRLLLLRRDAHIETEEEEKTLPTHKQDLIARFTARYGD